jgi:hypothetical protein
MNIGDKVRFMHGQEEGIVRGFANHGMVEVEIEVGFTIPALQKDLVVVAKEEEVHFRKDKPSSSPKEKEQIKSSTVFSERGLFVGFASINDQVVSLNFINNTDYDILFSLSTVEKQNHYGLTSASVQPRTFTKIADWQISEFDKWPSLAFQILYHRPRYFAPKAPMLKTINFKASTFFKKKTIIPVMEKQGFLLQIDSDSKPIDLDQVKNSMFQQSESNITHSSELPESVVDLHIEKLTNKPQTMAKEEILKLQLEIFQKKLDQAIVAGYDSITFVHGVGNGVLRDRIHKICSQMDHIRFFKDARKEKFGYGATEVRIK